MKVLRTIILSTCLLAFGTLATLSTKWQSSTYAKGLNGELKRFEHPGVQTLLMFIGMAICLVYYLCRTAFFPSTNQQRPKLWEPVLLVPTTLDLTQNALAVVGLLWIPVSIWCVFLAKNSSFCQMGTDLLSGRQMLNGAIVVFGAIFSVVILKRKMTPLRWVAIGFATIGLALVGTSGILNESSEGVSGKFIIGIALVLGGQVVGSLHMISEEKLMSYTDPFDPDHLAGIVRRFLFFTKCNIDYLSMPFFSMPPCSKGSMELF
jgi:drug/metabolite transporter (DMT)-like permease